MHEAIEINDLRKAYGDVEAVRDISFSVAAGEVFCLLGPNGAGKTTTTEILEGYRARSAGEVRVFGHDPEDGERALRERVGIVLQESAAQAELTVAEVLTMYGRYYPRHRPVGQLVELVGLAGEEGQRVKLLSGGQRRRLDLALALVGDPGRPSTPSSRARARRSARRASRPPSTARRWCWRPTSRPCWRGPCARRRPTSSATAGHATARSAWSERSITPPSRSSTTATAATAATAAVTGLIGLETRVREAGGRLEAGPRDDGPGFRVLAVVPVGSER